MVINCPSTGLFGVHILAFLAFSHILQTVFHVWKLRGFQKRREKLLVAVHKCTLEKSDSFFF